MKKLLLLLSLGLITSCNVTKGLVDSMSPLQTPFEKNDNYSASYHEVIDYYQLLDRTSLNIQVNEYGMTDSGKPLHEVILDKSRSFTPEEARKAGKAVLMINNGIHAGEPCGIDASMMLARDLLEDKASLLDSTIVVIVPVYNIGGVLNRGGYSRANQNGPSAYGFRGNAKNLDLNRDFIKQDSDNAKSFNQLFTKWNPDIFMDNHTSNGADYQYVITLIATQKDKLEANLSRFMTNELLTEIYPKMESKGYEMTPYVFSRSSPDQGIAGFLDLPRYSSGYAALHNTISFMPETHMFKEYKDRVKSTYFLMESMLEFIQNHKQELIDVRERAIENTKIQEKFDLNWTLDFDKEDKLIFKGYEYRQKKSKVTGLDRNYYDRSRPFEKEVPFYNTYQATLSVEKPRAYIIPQAYQEVIDRLKANGVSMERIQEDQEIELEVYRIEDYVTRDNAYEGHYPHSQVQVVKNIEKVKIYQGDYRVKTDQAQNRLIVHTLEPQAADSYFSWNFFDGILMQKEYFSPYVFEEIAEELLEDDRDLRNRFEQKRRDDRKFKENASEQLNFIYMNSPYYEKTYRRYPVYREL
ncbi:M14 family zinc carboxypeptidase [Portibacter marinus]|uniref:M14 family zinc carboxypeptidase n=1 Tax=Portibacter marinus TaxID=2898660 RepID=UPI001F4504B0|nr:M14 family zinc carboxypeptidase [Portibacter marinus]